MPPPSKHLILNVITYISITETKVKAIYTMNNCNKIQTPQPIIQVFRAAFFLELTAMCLGNRPTVGPSQG